MNDVITIIVDTPTPVRLDVYLSGEVADFSRSHIQKLIEEGCVTLNGVPSDSKKKVKSGDEIVLRVPLPKECVIPKQDIDIDVVYQDEWLAVIDKPQGLTVHPANNVYTGTLVNALLYRFTDLSGINGDLRPGIVHRLDKNTSGLMVVAKNDVAHRALAEQISDKRCRRIYYALVEGVIKEDEIINRLRRSATKSHRHPLIRQCLPRYNPSPAESPQCFL
ncbi:MAG: RluA family pseudouridine synthase, partial [Clostridia bacterium]|nr:RluA family pseudouridine synthase [Clostridia bacterium]